MSLLFTLPCDADGIETIAQTGTDSASAQSQQSALPSSAQTLQGSNPNSPQAPTAAPTNLSTFPHGYVHIHFETPQARWYFFPTATTPIEFSRKPYGFKPSPISGQPMPNGGLLCSLVKPCSVTLGTDLTAKTVDGIIFSSILKDKSSVEAELIKSINLMVGKPDAVKTAADLHMLLDNPLTITSLSAGNRDFYLFSPDGHNLQLMPASQTIKSLSWMAKQISKSQLGTALIYVNGQSAPVENVGIPVVTPNPYCQLLQSSCWIVLNEKLHWKHGSGIDGFLGKLVVTNSTDIYTRAVCSPAVQ